MLIGDGSGSVGDEKAFLRLHHIGRLVEACHIVGRWIGAEFDFNRPKVFASLQQKINFMTIRRAEEVRLTGFPRIARSSAFFLTRAKDNLRFSRQRSMPVDYATGVRSDQIGRPTLAQAREDFPSLLRRVRYFDKENDRYLIFLTNNLNIPALTVAKLYRLRWRIELFFRWIKGHLRIKHYYGTSPNAVKTQIWIAHCVYLMVAILHKELKLPGTLHRTLQLLSVHPFEKVPIRELLTENTQPNLDASHHNWLTLWNL